MNQQCGALTMAAAACRSRNRAPAFVIKLDDVAAALTPPALHHALQEVQRLNTLVRG